MSIKNKNNYNMMKKSIYKILSVIIFPVYLFALLFAAIIARISRKKNAPPRLVWGSTPIISYANWSEAMSLIGFRSETYTKGFYSTINQRKDWDKIVEEEYRYMPTPVKPLIAFMHSLFKYDVFVTSFDGFFLGGTIFNYYQAQIIKIAGKKIIIIPYGADAYVYRRIRSIGLLHGLMMSYPKKSRSQMFISKNLDYWCRNADVVITGIMGPDGFGRWDVLLPSPFCLNLNEWSKFKPMINGNAASTKVVIAHAPNHRGFKGTEFIIEAVNKLKNEGLNIEFILLEKRSNAEVRKILCNDVDILIEQIIATGHGLNALEGMASGLPVISNLEDEAYILPMRRWSYFSECPIVSGTPENLVDVLRKLVMRPELRSELGKAGRAYIEKYHGHDSAQYLFSNVIDYMYGKKDSLINLYHPLLGEYPNRSPKIQHPLVNNRIVD